MNNLVTFLKSRIQSFRNAFCGLGFVLRTQKNTWIHFGATSTVTILAIWLKIQPLEWGILILTIGAVWTAELINTALEAVVDLTSPSKHPLAKVGKDVGAAAVLIAAISAAAIGILILGPPLWRELSRIIAGADQ